MNKKFSITKEQLENFYIEDDKSAYEISLLLNCATRTVRKYLKKYNIPRKIGSRTRIKIDYNELYQLYIMQKKSAIEIAKFYNCNEETIRNRLKLYNIKIRNCVNINKDDLYQFYIIDKKTIKELCEFYSCSRTTIHYNLDRFNIPRKYKFKGNISKNELYDLYINKKNSLNKIGKLYHCSIGTIVKFLKKYNIKIRKNNEKSLPDIIGKKFGKLVVIKFSYKEFSISYWECKCDCGNIKIGNYNALKYGHLKSCGCLIKHNGDHAKTGYMDITGNHFCHIKRCATDRGLEFSITIEDLWNQWIKQNGLCALTGRKLILKNTAKTFSKKTASVDRIDSSRGYIIDNVRWVHKDINQIKWKFTDKEFINICNEIVNFNKKDIE